MAVGRGCGNEGERMGEGQRRSGELGRGEWQSVGERGKERERAG